MRERSQVNSHAGTPLEKHKSTPYAPVLRPKVYTPSKRYLGGNEAWQAWKR
jgi:hypothetical protein